MKKEGLTLTASDKFDEKPIAELAYIKPSQQVFFTEDQKTDTFKITIGGKTTAEFGREDAERLGIRKAAEAQKLQKPPETVICPVCKNKVTTRQFCPECGTRLFCPGCGNRVGQTKFCPECGTGLI